MNPLTFLKRAVNALLNLVLPFLEKHVPPKGLWFGLRFRRYTKYKHGAFQQQFVDKVYGGKEPRVLSGPFAGMTYFNGTFFGPITPRWLGSYESQLHPIVEKFVHKSYSVVVDVGSAEGYYSVGLARLLPKAEVFSFDTDPISRRQQARLARINNVTNVKIGAFCHWKEFESVTKNKRSLGVIDIDSHELFFLQPDKCPALLKCDLLVEIHEGFGFDHEGFRAEILKRFQESHHSTIIPDIEIDINKYHPLVTALTEEEVREAVKECRAVTQSWLWLEARNPAKTGRSEPHRP